MEKIVAIKTIKGAGGKYYGAGEELVVGTDIDSGEVNRLVECGAACPPGSSTDYLEKYKRAATAELLNSTAVEVEEQERRKEQAIEDANNKAAAAEAKNKEAQKALAAANKKIADLEKKAGEADKKKAGK